MKKNGLQKSNFFLITFSFFYLLIIYSSPILAQPQKIDTPKKIQIEKPKLLNTAEFELACARYNLAIKLLEELKDANDFADYIEYLKILAYYRNNDLQKALQLATNFIEKFKDSKYKSKIEYLKADIYFAQKKYQQSAEIYINQVRDLLKTDKKNEVYEIYLKLINLFMAKEKDEIQPQKKRENLEKAYNYYKKILTLELTFEQRDNALFKAA